MTVPSTMAHNTTLTTQHGARLGRSHGQLRRVMTQALDTRQVPLVQNTEMYKCLGTPSNHPGASTNFSLLCLAGHDPGKECELK